ncbi:hypothetical protein MHM87_04785 [Alteromonas sp. Cnat3-28]|uniref:hypothetical protein n=1 Tax=Alteromonas sp. Cnat3-28 TaxID=2917729 RepID=UPI001EF66177|nr:hypothetical protein [Alteromonas sp. Cnat3-28]MCG7644902.1 hypothetical protein [Alteromonas sp. Cnat3-28]
MTQFANGIGGYGELELPFYNHPLHEEAYSFQSARAALFCFLKHTPVETVLLPDYICDSLYPIFENLQIKVNSYAINEALTAPTNISVGSNEMMLIVNYFGICREAINRFLRDSGIPTEKIIVDNSQALFEPVGRCAATIYSPRKFLGIPDGAFLYTDSDITTPSETFQATDYVGHLLERSAGKIYSGYQKFLEAEHSLTDFLPKKMSDVSKRLIQSYDLESVKAKRLHHFNQLQCAFQDINLNPVFKLESEIPLCFPLKIDKCVTRMCQELIKSNIYLPRYWPNLNAKAQASLWFSNTLFLPVDHRLDETKLNFLILKVRELLK